MLFQFVGSIKPWVSSETIYTLKCLPVAASGWSLTAGTISFSQPLIYQSAVFMPGGPWAKSLQSSSDLNCQGNNVWWDLRIYNLFPRLSNSCWHSFDSHNHPELRGVWIFELFCRIHFSALNKCSAHRTWALGKPWTSGNCGHCFLGTWVWPFVEERLTWVLSILFLNSVSSRKWFSLLSLWKMRIVRGLTPFICMRRQWEDVYKLPGTVPISVQ